MVAPSADHSLVAADADKPAHTLPTTAPVPGISDEKAPGVLPVRSVGQPWSLSWTQRPGFAVNPFASAIIPEINTAITHLREVLGDQTYESLARKGETMSTAAMASYAYDQIDQARTELNAVSMRRLPRSKRGWHNGPPSWHRLGPLHMSFEAKRFRHGAVAIPIVAVGRVVAAGPRQQRAQPQQPDVADNQSVIGWRGR